MTNNSLINSLTDELSTLLKIRINRYHQQHKSVVNFINDLIIAPYHDDFSHDITITARRARLDFESNVGIKAFSLDLNGVALTKNMALEYYFDILFDVLDDYMHVVYNSETGLVELDSEIVDTISLDELQNIITKVQGEISFGSLLAA